MKLLTLTCTKMSFFSIIMHAQMSNSPDVPPERGWRFLDIA
jgi:hypothetical protein